MRLYLLKISNGQRRFMEAALAASAADAICDALDRHGLPVAIVCRRLKVHPSRRGLPRLAFAPGVIETWPAPARWRRWLPSLKNLLGRAC